VEWWWCSADPRLFSTQAPPIAKNNQKYFQKAFMKLFRRVAGLLLLP
jgi:hypothetical protein